MTPAVERRPEPVGYRGPVPSRVRRHAPGLLRRVPILVALAAFWHDWDRLGYSIVAVYLILGTWDLVAWWTDRPARGGRPRPERS